VEHCIRFFALVGESPRLAGPDLITPGLQGAAPVASPGLQSPGPPAQSAPSRGSGRGRRTFGWSGRSREHLSPHQHGRLPPNRICSQSRRLRGGGNIGYDWAERCLRGTLEPKYVPIPTFTTEDVPRRWGLGVPRIPWHGQQRLDWPRHLSTFPRSPLGMRSPTAFPLRLRPTGGLPWATEVRHQLHHQRLPNNVSSCIVAHIGFCGGWGSPHRTGLEPAGSLDRGRWRAIRVWGNGSCPGGIPSLMILGHTNLGPPPRRVVFFLGAVRRRCSERPSSAAISCVER